MFDNYILYYLRHNLFLNRLFEVLVLRLNLFFMSYRNFYTYISLSDKSTATHDPQP